MSQAGQRIQADVGSLMPLFKRCKGGEFSLWVNLQHDCNISIGWKAVLPMTIWQAVGAKFTNTN